MDRILLANGERGSSRLYQCCKKWLKKILPALPGLGHAGGSTSGGQAMAQAVQETGGHTISVDEMTRIQALEHKYPDKPVMPGKMASMEFEYIRHGTTSLIGFFDIATGRMETPYLNGTRTEEDFLKAVKALVETDPDASWTFVCDGLNTHKSESLVRFVAEQCGLRDELGCKGKFGILKNQKSRAYISKTTEFVSFTPRNITHG